MKESIEGLIAKFLRNELSQSEANLLKSWMELPENRAFLQNEIELYHLVNAYCETFDAEKAYEQHLAVVVGGKATIIRSLWPRYVAAAAILAVLTFGFYFGRNALKDKANANLVATEHVIEPGTDKAILTLADGKKIVLDASQSIINLDAHHQISSDSSGLISYENMELNASQAAYNTIEIPKGGTYRLILSDGTKVWLNAASKLKYPVAYQGKERVVELEGEAYFEVTKDPSRKFKVKSKGQELEVLGTKFNVSTYSDEAFVKTTLLEGAVKVSNSKKSVVLSPNQVSINAKSGLHVQTLADAEEAIAWKNGYFQFDDEPIESVMRKIARWYDIEIEFVGKSEGKKFNGIITRNKTLKNALKIMEATENVKFKIEGRKLIVKT
ncbi:FecR family protein [Pedobacter helvus]|uniref:FecR family protein n=1 Tax=Pedobacter helvus TaxID=2563444 RepID=A0ABW9JGI6_9SPHI|nr:FecR family protein [Pedobacter ureilyticus]